MFVFAFVKPSRFRVGFTDFFDGIFIQIDRFESQVKSFKLTVLNDLWVMNIIKLLHQ